SGERVGVRGHDCKQRNSKHPPAHPSPQPSPPSTGEREQERFRYEAKLLVHRSTLAARRACASAVLTPSPLYSGERVGVRGHDCKQRNSKHPPAHPSPQPSPPSTGEREPQSVREDVKLQATRPASARRGSRSAFSILELLVAVSIIIILCGFILAAVGRGRAAAQGVTCVARLHSISIALTQRARDHMDRFPDPVALNISWE